MKRRRSGAIYAFAPILVIYFVANGLSIALTQLSIAGILVVNGSMEYSELIKESIRFLSSKDFLIVSNIANGVCCAIIFAIWYNRLVKSEHDNSDGKMELDLGRMKGLVFPGIVLVALACQFIGRFLLELLTRMVPAWIVSYTNSLDSIGLSAYGDNTGAPVYFIIYIIIVAPIMEELAFRGVGMKYALRGLPAQASIIVTSILFSAMHTSMLQMAYTFLFALVLGYIYTKTGKIYICIIIHMIFNGISIFIPEYINIGGNALESFIILLTSMAALYVGVLMLTRPIFSAEGGNYER